MSSSHRLSCISYELIPQYLTYLYSQRSFLLGVLDFQSMLKLHCYHSHVEKATEKGHRKLDS